MKIEMDDRPRYTVELRGKVHDGPVVQHLVPRSGSTYISLKVVEFEAVLVARQGEPWKVQTFRARGRTVNSDHTLTKDTFLYNVSDLCKPGYFGSYPRWVEDLLERATPYGELPRLTREFEVER